MTVTSRDLFYIFLVAAAYAVAGMLGVTYALIHSITLFWPPSGIALASILIGGFRLWPGVALGALTIELWSGYSLSTALGITVGNTLEALCGAYLFRYMNNFALTLHRVSDVLKLAVSGLISCTIAASFGTLFVLLQHPCDLQQAMMTWIAWWLGDGMGVILIAPAILAVYSDGGHWRQKIFASWHKPLEASVLIASMLIVCGIIFDANNSLCVGYLPMSMTLFPFVLWSALRFSAIGVATTSLIIAWITIFGTTHNTGPFISHSLLASEIVWCLYTDLIVLTGFIVAAVDYEREHMLDKMNQQVQLRTRELEAAHRKIQEGLQDRLSLQSEMNQITEERQKLIGQELHDGLGQQLLGASLLMACIQRDLATQIAPSAAAINEIGKLLDESINTLRALSRGLFPVVLDSGGLPAALRHLALYSQNASGIACVLKCPRDLQFENQSLMLCLYRITQEALTNALRHSGAQQVEITLTKHRQRYQLSISDNGRGFPELSSTLPATLGMRSMRNRAQLARAQIELINNSTGGATVIVSGEDSAFSNGYLIHDTP